MGQYLSEPGTHQDDPSNDQSSNPEGIPLQEPSSEKALPKKPTEKSPTHLVVAHIEGEEVLENAKKLQKEVKTKYPDLMIAKIRPESFHVTLFVMSLAPDQIRQAETAFANVIAKIRATNQGEHDVTFQSIGQFDDRVIFGAVDDTSHRDLNQLRSLIR